MPTASSTAAATLAFLSTASEIEFGSGFGVSISAEQRHDDEEVDEVVGGEHARRDRVAALRRLGAEPAETEADQHEDPEELACRAGGRSPTSRARCRATAGRRAGSIEPNIAMTPPSLLGIERRIA